MEFWEHADQLAGPVVELVGRNAIEMAPTDRSPHDVSVCRRPCCLGRTPDRIDVSMDVRAPRPECRVGLRDYVLEKMDLGFKPFLCGNITEERLSDFCVMMAR